MRKILLFLVVFIASCKKESCECEDIIGKKWYIFFKQDNLVKLDTYYDDHTFKSDGFIDLHRNYADPSNNETIVNAAKYTIKENCILKIDKVKDVQPYSLGSFSIGKGGESIPITLVTCTSFNVGLWTFTDYNPR